MIDKAMFEALQKAGEQHEQRIRGIAREAAREEVASLCGLILRRLQDTPEITVLTLEKIFGEGLRDFSATASEPGPEPT